MNVLRWFNVGILLFGASMALCFAVVCLIYGYHMDTTPRLREEWPMLVWSTLLFAGVGAVAGLGTYGLQRNKAWKWIAQGVLVTTVVVVTLVFSEMLRQ